MIPAAFHFLPLMYRITHASFLPAMYPVVVSPQTAALRGKILFRRGEPLGAASGRRCRGCAVFIRPAGNAGRVWCFPLDERLCRYCRLTGAVPPHGVRRAGYAAGISPRRGLRRFRPAMAYPSGGDPLSKRGFPKRESPAVSHSPGRCPRAVGRAGYRHTLFYQRHDEEPAPAYSVLRDSRHCRPSYCRGHILVGVFWPSDSFGAVVARGSLNPHDNFTLRRVHSFFFPGRYQLPGDS